MIKTLLCEAAFFATLMMVFSGIWLISLRNGFILRSIDQLPAEWLVNVIVSAIMIVEIVFFWLLSYFRLKETEA